MKNILIISLLLLIMGMHESNAQKTGRIDYNSRGISYVIPNGWIGNEVNGSMVLTSASDKGFVLISTNNNNDINTMIQEARQGISDANGNYLQIISPIEKYNDIVIGGEYEGVIEGFASKAYIIGVANPYGSGLSIMVSSTSNYYTTKYKQLCIDIANTIEVYSPKKTHALNKMEEFFGGAKLSYYDSYNSGYGGGGYSTKIIIDLCPQAYFNYFYNDNLSVSGGSVSGGYADDNKGSGKWKIIENINTQPVLQLLFYSGELYEYNITFDGKKTYLNGKRYFRVYGEDGASCY